MTGKHVSPSSRKRDRQSLERRRFEASFEAVSNWVEVYNKNGPDGLKSQGHPGQKSQLSDSERKKLKATVLKGPKAFGYDTDVLALERIADVIRMAGGFFEGFGTVLMFKLIGKSR
jgi:hypothetical protein